MTTADHPLTETAAAELWDTHRDPSAAPFHAQGRLYRRGQTALIRAAFDAGREHERTTPAEVTDEAAKAVSPGPRERITNDIGEWVEVEMREGGYSFLHMGCGHMMGLDTPDRAALSTALAVATPADPHHDPRPWQDCTREDIREGDLVAVQYNDRLGIGVAHHQDADGDWWTEGGYSITYGDRWPLRRIPAPTPPAEEVELPTEPGSVLTNVYAFDGSDHAEAAVLARDGFWYGNWAGGAGVQAVALAAFTLRDGTRARRDGEHEDGTPRFVKEDA